MTGRPARRSGAARPTLARAAAALASRSSLSRPSADCSRGSPGDRRRGRRLRQPRRELGGSRRAHHELDARCRRHDRDNSYTGDLDATSARSITASSIPTEALRRRRGGEPLLPMPRHHDWDQGVDCDGESCHGAHLDYFALPGNERYYDFAAGPVRFFMVDSDVREPHGTTAGSAQAEWLKTALAASTARWNIVCFHHSPYSSGSASPGLRWPSGLGSDAVISAHLHVYERVMKSGFPYFVNGLGGRSKHPFGAIEPGSAIRFNAAFARCGSSRPQRTSPSSSRDRRERTDRHIRDQGADGRPDHLGRDQGGVSIARRAHCEPNRGGVPWLPSPRAAGTYACAFRT